jgi:galactose mutarotase-like enzyme
MTQLGPRDPFIRRSGGHFGRLSLWEGHEVIELSSPDISLKISLSRGAEIFELRAKAIDQDLLWHGLEDIVRHRPATQSISADMGNFLDHFSGGWQEVLPAAQYPINYRGAQVGGHGEVAMLSWDYRILKDSENQISVEFSVNLRRFPLRLIRVMTLTEGVLRFDERVENQSADPIDFQWGQHLALGGQLIAAGAELVVNSGEPITVPDYPGPTYRFTAPSESTWPQAHLADGSLADITTLPVNDGTDGHLILGPMTEPKVLLRNENLGIEVKVEWDKQTYPYCWIWMVWGGIKGWPLWGRDRLITIEPFSSIVQSLDEAIKDGSSLVVSGNGNVTSWVTFEIVSNK